MLKDKDPSLTEKLLSVRVKRVCIRANLNRMTALVQRMKDGVENKLSNVYAEVQKTFEDIVKAVKLKILAVLVNGRNKMETRFQLETTRLTVNASDELLRQSSDVSSFLEKSATLFDIRSTKTLDVVS